MIEEKSTILSEEQLAVVNSDSKAILIVALPGAGKTTLLIAKLERFLEQGLDPKRMLVCCFTRKAAEEMKVRLEKKLLDTGKNIENMNELWVSTIHSVCVRLIRKYHLLTPYTKNFTIADDVKQLRIAKDVCRLSLSYQNREREFIYKVSRFKNTRPNTKEYKEYEGDLDFYPLYEEYNKLLRKEDSMDFDDMLIIANDLLGKQGVLTDVQNMFDVVMVDEFQDVNWVQYDFFNKIAQAPHIKYVVVGDDDQCIYGFRGSDIKYILNHEKNIPDCTVFHLTENFRCPQNVVKLSEQIVLPSSGRRKKVLMSKKENDESIYFDAYVSNEIEALNVAGRIEELALKKIPYSSIAVLYRVGAQSRVLEEAFIKNNIPYKVVGGFSFYDRKEVKDTLAIIRLLTGNKHRDYIDRLINVPPRGIGDKTLDKMNALDIPLWDVLINKDSYSFIKGKAKKGIDDFVSLVNRFQVIDTRDAAEIRKKVYNYVQSIDYINKEFANDSPEKKEQRMGNVLEVLNALENFYLNKGTLEEFFEYVIDMTEKDEKNNINSVSLMTMHASKGLEFDNVFIVGVQDNLVPHYHSLNNASSMDGERRLFYVALTRTRHRLFLSCNNLLKMNGSPTMFFDTFKWENFVKFDDHSLDEGGPKFYGNPVQELNKYNLMF